MRRYRKAVGRASRLGGGGGCVVGGSCQYYVMGQGTTIPGVYNSDCLCVRADSENKFGRAGRMVGASGRGITRTGAMRGGVVQGMMAFSGRGGRMSLVQRAQRGLLSQRPQISQSQAQRAGVAMGMMAASGKRSKASGSNKRFGFRNTCGCS
jgi:hypothetical protein